ncbi:glycosyltransferase family 2 protein [Pseudomonas brenneri]
MLTIVIPSYNHAEYIISCLDAALAVEPATTQVLVIDDGSPDNTLTVLQEYLDTHSAANRVTVIAKKNSGLVNSLNLALSMIETEFVYFIASDDVAIPEGINRMLSKVRQLPCLNFVIGGGIYFYGDRDEEGPVYKRKHKSFFELSPTKRHDALFLDYPAPILLQSTLFKTSTLREVGGWDSSLKLDDYPMFVKLFQHSAMYDKDFAFMSNVNVVRYRQHDLNSYRDVVKQYGLVEQTLDSITPERLRAKAKGRALAFYFLVAIKSRAFGASVQILKVAGTKQSIRGILSLPYVAYLHLLRDKV